MFSVHYTLPVRSDMKSVAGITNSSNEINGIIVTGGVTGPTGPSGNGVTGPTGPSGGGGSSLQKGTEIIDTFSEVLSYTGTIVFNDPFNEIPVVVGSSSMGTMNITDVTEDNFSFALTTSSGQLNFTSVTGAQYSATSRLTIINGHPASIYVADNLVLIIRSLDSNGLTWPNTPILIDTLSGLTAQRPGVNFVNGFPVVSYYDGDARILYYISALDINGDTWGTRMVVDDTLNDYQQDYTSLLIVDGKPCIAYFSWQTTLRYAYSSVSIPTSSSDWTHMIVANIDFGGNYSWPEMIIIGGNPVICYPTGNQVFVIKSTIPFPIIDTDWGSPVLVISGDVKSISFEIVNTKPSIVVWVSNNIKYISSFDNGDTWDVIANIPALNNVPYVMKVINNIPMICYTDENNNYILSCVLANNPDGTSWGTPFVLSLNYRVDYYVQVIDNDGLGIFFFDTTTSYPIYMSSIKTVAKLYYMAS